SRESGDVRVLHARARRARPSRDCHLSSARKGNALPRVLPSRPGQLRADRNHTISSQLDADLCAHRRLFPRRSSPDAKRPSRQRAARISAAVLRGQYITAPRLPRPAGARGPRAVVAGSSFRVPYRLENRAEQTLMPSYPFRIGLGYRWFDPSGAAVATDNAPRTLLPAPVATGEAVHGWIDVDANCAPGR